jgi:hypothetical protein
MSVVLHHKNLGTGSVVNSRGICQGVVGVVGMSDSIVSML